MALEGAFFHDYKPSFEALLATHTDPPLHGFWSIFLLQVKVSTDIPQTYNYRRTSRKNKNIHVAASPLEQDWVTVTVTDDFSPVSSPPVFSVLSVTCGQVDMDTINTRYCRCVVWS